MSAARESRAETGLIDRYVRAVGRNLPAKTRRDAEADLLASLREQVEARLAAGAGDLEEGAEAGGDREAIEIALLKELGPPEELARSYLPPGSYLIGPELHGGFVAVLKICLGLLTILLIVGLASNLGGLTAGVGSFVRTLGQALGQFLEMALKVFGVIVLIFAAIERAAMPRVATALKPAAAEAATGAALGAATAAEPPPTPEWTPDAIPEADDDDSIARGHAAFRLGFVLLGLVVLNFFPHWLGIWVGIDSEYGVVPLLGPGFARWLWLLNLSLGASLVVNLMLLRSRRWGVGTRLLDVVSDVLGLAWIYSLAHEPDVVSVDSACMVDQGWTVEAAEKLVGLLGGPLGSVIQIGLWFGVLGAAAGVLATLARLWRTARR